MNNLLEVSLVEMSGKYTLVSQLYELFYKDKVPYFDYANHDAMGRSAYSLMFDELQYANF